MKKIYSVLIIILVVATACGDNDLGIDPKNENYPFRLVLDADEGADLATAEDYAIEVKFADYLGELPSEPITIGYFISGIEGDMEGVVDVDKVVYEVEINDCVYERELSFVNDGFYRTITISPDEDLGTVPESFEIVLTLPGFEGAEGRFTFNISYLQTENKNVILGLPASFEYEVLDNEVAGGWELELADAEEFATFKEVFGVLNAEFAELEFADLTGKITAEFEFEEMKFVIELSEEEDITVCENGESETETENLIFEIEAEYDAEDGEIKFEGSHVVDDDGVETELDFWIEAEYSADGSTLTITIYRIADEDNRDDEHLFLSEEGVSFTFTKN